MFSIQQTRDVKADKQKASAVFFQPKLSVNRPNDVYEQEADAMADKVMRMADASVNQDAFFKPANNTVQRKCQLCEEEDKKVHRKENSDDQVQGSNELDSYVNTLGSSGQFMPQSSRQFFEPRFARDFSNVRVHTDSVAAKSAQSINALAYTTGNNIVFNSGQYSPDSDSGKKLMAHELTHVVQQKENNISRQEEKKAENFEPKDYICIKTPDPSGIQITKFSDKEQLYVSSAIQGARSKAHQSYDKLATGDQYVLKIAKKVFKQDLAFDFLSKNVKSIYDKLNILGSGLAVERGTCDHPTCNTNVLAITKDDLSGVIICPFFFRASVGAMITTLIHEAGHLANIDTNWKPGNETYCNRSAAYDWDNPCPLVNDNVTLNVDAWMIFIDMTSSI